MQPKKFHLILFVSFYLFSLNAQIQVPFDSVRWDIRAQKYQLTEYKGQKALFMQGGIALLEEAKFKDGIIEWDMAFPEERGFTGVRFRIEDLRNFEEFYFRPHQSGKPDANQYCPVDNGVSSWQLYHGPEYAVPYEYSFNKWFHVKLIVAGSRAELYIDNMRFPILHIPVLKRKPVEGKLMVYGNRVPTYFANFSYTPMDDKPSLVNDPVKEREKDPLTISEWSVSNAFPAQSLQNIMSLDNLNTNDFTWQILQSENTGTANLATIADFDRQVRNTVFAKVILQSSKDQIKGLHIGFSDQAKVYCNGQAIFSGNDTYVTRDYRYLGTIGYFDTVYLPLKAGRNEVWIAVTESFGGWGIQGKLEDSDDVQIVK